MWTLQYVDIQRINGMGAVTTREVYDRIMGQSNQIRIIVGKSVNEVKHK
jgi:hypothetical protein